MEARELFLLHPHRLPGQTLHTLSDAESAAFLNGYLALWHPAALTGAAKPPDVGSPYEHEEPTAGFVYAVPDSPQMVLPEDWEQRVSLANALRFTATADRAETIRNLLETIGAKPQADGGFKDLDPSKVAPFVAIGFGYLMLNTLFEAMEHENLLDGDQFWQKVQEAVAALNQGGDDYRSHLQAAADLMLAAREGLFPSSIHVIDLALIDEKHLDAPLPAAFDHELPINLVASASVLEKLNQAHPERITQFRDRLENDKLDICCGGYLEREDALLPLESQLWNLLQGIEKFKEVMGHELRVFGRQKFGAHPQMPVLLGSVGIQFGLLLPLDGGELPVWHGTTTSWSAPDGKQVDVFTRRPMAADSPQTFFGLVHYLRKSIETDSSATLALLHRNTPPAPWYHDWIELTRFAPILGQWVTLRFYLDEVSSEYAPPSSADDFRSDYLEQRAKLPHSHPAKGEPISWFPHQTRLRRRIDTLWTLSAIHRGLAGANDTLNMDARLAGLEAAFETGQDVAAELDQVQHIIGDVLTQRLLSRAKEDRPGFMVLNPCSFTRRVVLELDGVAGPLPVEGPIKAAQFADGKAQLVIEVPALGFAWFPKQGPPGTPPPPKRMVLADKTGVRNEYFEAEIDPATGGLRAYRDLRTRLNRVGQQLVFNPGSTMSVKDMQIVSTGPALGEVITSGEIIGPQEQVLAKFRQRFRAWMGRPLLELHIEIDPVLPPAGDPWHSFFAARFAWREERTQLVRGLHGSMSLSNAQRPETPDNLDLRLGRQSTSIFPGGLPFHQRHESRMLDVLLITEGESARSFDLALGLDREFPMQTALGIVSPVVVIPTTKGPPHVGASGWLFHLDAPNLLMTSLRPAPENYDGLTARMLECTSYGGQATFRTVRNPIRAELMDARGHPVSDGEVSDDSAQFDFAAGDLIHLRLDFS